MRLSLSVHWRPFAVRFREPNRTTAGKTASCHREYTPIDTNRGGTRPATERTCLWVTAASPLNSSRLQICSGAGLAHVIRPCLRVSPGRSLNPRPIVPVRGKGQSAIETGFRDRVSVWEQLVPKCVNNSAAVTSARIFPVAEVFLLVILLLLLLHQGLGAQEQEQDHE